MKTSTLSALCVLGFSLLGASLPVQAGPVHPTYLREKGNGFRVQLVDKVNGNLLASQRILCRTVYHDARRPHKLEYKTTNVNGVVFVDGGSSVLKAVFIYDGRQGKYGGSKHTDSNP